MLASLRINSLVGCVLISAIDSAVLRGVLGAIRAVLTIRHVGLRVVRVLSNFLKERDFRDSKVER